MEKVINKGMEMTKNYMSKMMGYTKMITDQAAKSVETVVKYAPKTSTAKLFADNVYAGTLLSIATMSLFTKADKRVLKVLFSISFIGKIVGDKLINKYAEKEAIENMNKSIQGWTIHEWINKFSR